MLVVAAASLKLLTRLTVRATRLAANISSQCVDLAIVKIVKAFRLILIKYRATGTYFAFFYEEINN